MGENDREFRRVKTCDTVFDIVDAIMEEDGSTIPEVAERLDLARSTVHGHLTTLEDRGLLVKRGREYDLSFKFFQYGCYRVQKTDVISIAKPGLKRLAETTGETVWLTMAEHGHYVNVDKEVGEQGIQTKGKLGGRYPLHAGAAGKTFLAHYPDDHVRKILDAELEPVADDTLTSMDELFEELASIEADGIAFSDGEVTERVRGVAAPIVVDEIVAAILVSGPKNRLQGPLYDEKIPRLLKGVTNSIELELEYQ